MIIIYQFAVEEVTDIFHNSTPSVKGKGIGGGNNENIYKD